MLGPIKKPLPLMAGKSNGWTLIQPMQLWGWQLIFGGLTWTHRIWLVMRCFSLEMMLSSRDCIYIIKVSFY